MQGFEQVLASANGGKVDGAAVVALLEGLALEAHAAQSGAAAVTLSNDLRSAALALDAAVKGEDMPASEESAAAASEKPKRRREKVSN